MDKSSPSHLVYDEILKSPGITTRTIINNLKSSTGKIWRVEYVNYILLGLMNCKYITPTNISNKFYSTGKYEEENNE